MPKHIYSTFGPVLMSLALCFLMVACVLPYHCGKWDVKGMRTPDDEPLPLSAPEAAIAPADADDSQVASGTRAGGSYVILTNIAKGDPYYNAVTALKNYRGATVIAFDPEDLDSLLLTLTASPPRYVALVMKPIDIHINFTREFLMMSTNIDPDPFCDFSYGFITGATAQDALNFVNNVIKAEAQDIQNYPLNISGYVATSLNFVYPLVSGYQKYLNPPSFSDIWLETNDSGVGRDFFHLNKAYLKNNKLLDVGQNGDPHMLWLFEGGNFNPNPPSWSYDPAKIEDPAYARVGLTSNNLSGLDLYPAVVFNGACHAGEPKTVMIEGDIEATFGDTGGLVEFYTMSDSYSFALSMLKTNVTGYFAPCGANNANDQGEDIYNALLYHEPLGDIHKRSNDGVVMGCLGNRPNLRIFEEGESTYLSDILPSGTFDPEDWSGAKYMLGGKANRIYFGDPLFDPFKYNRSDKLNLSTWEYHPNNSTSLNINLTFQKPDNTEAYFPVWEKFHFGGIETRIYAAIDLPPEYSNVTDVKMVYNESKYDLFIHAIEQFDGKTILHVELDIPQDNDLAISYNATFQVTVPEVLATGNYDVAFLEGNQTGQVLPNGTYPYILHVMNNGTSADNISLSNNTAPSGWKLDIDFNGTAMAPGENRTAVVNVTAPKNAIANATWSLLLTATSQGNTSISETLNLTTTVSAVIDFTVAFYKSSNSTLPGQPCGYRANLINLGNANITLFTYYPELDQGWSIDLPGQRDIDPYHTVYFDILITPAENTTAGPHQVLISVGRPDRQVNNTLEVIVLPVYRPLFTTEDQSGYARPAEAKEYTLPIANLGNIMDDLVLNITSVPAGWAADIAFNGTNVTSAWWDSDAGLNLSALRPQDLRNATVRVTPPADAAGDLVGIVTLQVYSASDPSAFDNITLNTTVEWVHRFAVNASSNETGRPGTWVYYMFNVTNAGNGPEEVLSEASSAHGWYTYLYNETDTHLAPGGSVHIWAIVVIPPDSAVNLIDNLTVTFSSNNTPGLSATVQVTTFVMPLYTVVMESALRHQAVKVGENATFTFTVKNTGNTGFQVNLEMWGQHPEWTKLSQTSFYLEKNGTQTVTLFINAKTPGNSSFVVIAKPPEGSTSITFTLQVKSGPGAQYEDIPDTEGGKYTWCIVFIIIVMALLLVLVLYTILKKRRASQVPDDEDDVDEGEEEEGEEGGGEKEEGGKKERIGKEEKADEDDLFDELDDEGSDGEEDDEADEGEGPRQDEDEEDDEGMDEENDEDDSADSGDDQEDDDGGGEEEEDHDKEDVTDEEDDDEDDEEDEDTDQDEDDAGQDMDWDEEPETKSKRKR